MTPVGLVVALPGEQRTLTNARIPTGRYFRVNENTLIVLSGIGPDRAAAGAAILIEQGCKALLGWGCAAALDPGLRPGDLIVPEKVISAAGEAFEPDRQWRRNILDRLTRVRTIHAGAITESRRLVETASGKRALRDQTGACALDMESAAIAKVAAKHLIPFVTIRAIADPSGMDLPKPVALAVDREGNLKLPLLLTMIARYPGSIPGLIQLGFDFRAAQRSLRLSARGLEYDFYPDTAGADTGS